MDTSKDSRLNKDTDQLLPMHVPWCHSSVKNRYINITVGLSGYNNYKLSQVVVFMVQQQYKDEAQFCVQTTHHTHITNMSK